MTKVIDLLLIAFGLSATFQAQSQTTDLHQFSGVRRVTDQGIELTFSGSVSNTLRNFFDLYPIEVSSNLVDWRPLITLLRTNRASNALAHIDPGITQFDHRFYRTPTNQLPTPLPPPDGPFSVGVFSRLVTDPTRTNRYTRTNDSFMVTVWYPCEPATGVLPAFHSDPRLGDLGWCTTRSPTGFRSYSWPEVPVSPTEPKYPVVLYSHGDQLTRTDNTRRVENLVSFGFVVVAPDHWNCFATIFPTGQRLTGVASGAPGELLTMQIATNRAQDVQFLLSEIARWNRDDLLLRGRLDLERIGIFGMSFGGGTTTRACLQEPQIKAGVSLDGGYDRFPIPTIDRPFLILSGGDSDPFMKQFRDAYRNLFDRLTRDAYWVHIKDSTHCDFNDSPWFDAPTSTNRLRRALAMDRYTLSFFRKYLRREDDHLLDSPSTEWPEVDGFQKK